LPELRLPKKNMAQQTRKKKFSFAIASIFEGAQNITYFDADGNPIRKQRKVKVKKNSSPGQTSLL
jgi:hypothetical protein